MRYETILQGNPVLRARIDTIIETGRDGLALPSGSAIVDAMLRDLAAGTSLKEAKMHGELITSMQKAIEELYAMRDRGDFAVEGGG